MGTDAEPGTPAIDRRTLLKAGAWAPPVILLSLPAPAAAASVTATGQLNFTNLSYYWAYDATGGIVGLTANTRVIFTGPGATGTVTAITMVVTIQNPTELYLAGATPTILMGAPDWKASGPAETVIINNASWIRYTFAWTGVLAPNESTVVIEATVPLTTRQSTTPAGSPWTITASAPGAPGVAPATGAGLGTEFEDRGPITPITP